jgi:hypothetical protein
MASSELAVRFTPVRPSGRSRRSAYGQSMSSITTPTLGIASVSSRRYASRHTRLFTSQGGAALVLGTVSLGFHGLMSDFITKATRWWAAALRPPTPRTGLLPADVG